MTIRQILIHAATLLLIILSGYFMKKTGALKKTDGQILAKIIMTVTLPAAIIIGLKDVALSLALFKLTLTAVIVTVVLVSFAGFFWRKQAPQHHQLMMFTISGYNIGNFALPFIQGFYPVFIPFAIIFDIGNALMMFGGTEIMINHFSARHGSSITMGDILRRMLRSIPLMTYVVLLLLHSFSVPVPALVYQFAQPFANSNTFLSMFMVGLFLEFKLSDNDRQLVGKVLVTRYLLAAGLAVLIYLMPFFSLLEKKIILLMLFTPVATVSTIRAIEEGLQSETVGFIASISFIISFLLMTAVILFV